LYGGKWLKGIVSERFHGSDLHSGAKVSIFFTYILRALGFDAYPTGVRIRLREGGIPKGDYIGLFVLQSSQISSSYAKEEHSTNIEERVHIVNIVTLSTGEKYILDEGFGGDGPTLPMLLTEDNITTNLGTQQVRYMHEPIPQLSSRPSGHQKFWIYQYRNRVEQEWNSFYAFTEMEFLFQDFEVMSWFTSTNGNVSFQTTTVLIVKFVRDDEEESRIVGKIMLINGVVKKNMGGKTEVLKSCETEEERIQALEKEFGIVLSDEEKSGIRGFVTELRKEEIVG
jgi:arylamine N-acetyltransferase